ncbi:hypothetical protein B0T26DRAFT_270753 [Lasiosphaeria miniovina]|uniref:Uncharacterized protein n=1 Tax=Lasiosphaeria miniovina TaxID=1954250 RepID=A0AA40AJB5_9PEZI|nr:uncharacterized protein B0T26DRAFT_270753 [Lasiosphaeria miniovina]KAK0716936.1 hypothetical protein B0T26DRAFT_270753 [Lasiosphaeria miniovina]
MRSRQRCVPGYKKQIRGQRGQWKMDDNILHSSINTRNGRYIQNSVASQPARQTHEIRSCLPPPPLFTIKVR